MKIGVLALQGAFVEHMHKLRDLGVPSAEIRVPGDLQGLRGLIIPGGESTAIGKLMEFYGLTEPVRRFARRHAVWGTCAGMILMSRQNGENPGMLRLMDITVKRNAFGRQIDSFEEPLRVAVLHEGPDKPFPGVFIRAPSLVAARPPAQVIVRLVNGTAVAARQGRWLATAFHPELTRDPRFHRYFLDLVRS
jgi:5'-phosphate synthase pdxT subunit